MRFVSRSVVTGFVNALAILIFMAQLPELTGVTWPVYVMTAGGMAIIYLYPRLPVIDGAGGSNYSPFITATGLGRQRIRLRNVLPTGKSKEVIRASRTPSWRMRRS